MLTDNGLIIGVTELDERGRYLRVLTANGIFEIYARGAKKATSKNNAATELFCYSRLCAAPGKRGLVLDSSEPIRRFYDLRLDIKKLALAAYFAEAVMNFGVGIGSDPEKSGKSGSETLNLFLLCLHFLSGNERDPELIKAVFELRYACDIGFMPALVGCEICHRYDGDMWFETDTGKLLCEAHNPLHNGFFLPPALLHALRFICLSDLKKICDFKLPPDLLSALGNISEHYLIYHTEKKLKTLDYYHGT